MSPIARLVRISLRAGTSLCGRISPRILPIIGVVASMTCSLGSGGGQVGEISFLVALEPLPESAEHTAVEFPDRYNGYITRSDGVLLHSGNEGLTWTPSPTPTSAPLYDLAFLDPTTGFAVGGCTDCDAQGGVILQTTDRGETWSLVQQRESTPPLRGIVFASSDRGLIVGDEVILVSRNAGLRWDSYEYPGAFLNDVWMDSVDRGFAVGREGLLLASDDGGESWIEVATEHVGDLFAIAFADGIGYIASEHGLLRSFDDGLTWAEIEGAPTGLRATYFFDLDSGIVGGQGESTTGATLLLTNDYGDNWLGGLELDTVQSIRDFAFPTDDLGYAVGDGDQLVKLLRQ